MPRAFARRTTAEITSSNQDAIWKPSDVLRKVPLETRRRDRPEADADPRLTRSRLRPWYRLLGVSSTLTPRADAFRRRDGPNRRSDMKRPSHYGCRAEP